MKSFINTEVGSGHRGPARHAAQPVTDSARPRVFLVDDHELIRSGIRAEIAGSVDIVGEADEVEAAIEMILERSPDVVLLDVHMPDGGGQAVLRAVVEHATTTVSSSPSRSRTRRPT